MNQDDVLQHVDRVDEETVRAGNTTYNTVVFEVPKVAVGSMESWNGREKHEINHVKKMCPTQYCTVDYLAIVNSNTCECPNCGERVNIRPKEMIEKGENLDDSTPGQSRRY